jgi:hypothetical protein
MLSAKRCKPSAGVAAVMLTLSCLTGCSGSDSGSDATAVRVTPAPVGGVSASADQAQIEITRGKPTNEPSTSWQASGPKPSDTSITVLWTEAAATNCGTHVRRARLQETDDKVVIQLLPTTIEPTPLSEVCPALGRSRKADIALSAPLGTRTLMEPVLPPDHQVLP